MPIYLYKCPVCEKEDYRTHSATFELPIVCNECRAWMFKKPQPVSVNWNGNKPSDGGVTDLVRAMNKNSSEIKEQLDSRGDK